MLIKNPHTPTPNTHTHTQTTWYLSSTVVNTNQSDTCWFIVKIHIQFSCWSMKDL